MRHLVSACFLAMACFSMPAGAAPMTIATGTGIDGFYNINVTSFKEKAFRNTIRQQYDFSCGSAALATLLKYHYEYPISEDTIFEGMFKNGDQEKIKRYGFSMADMKRFLASRGIPAEGYSIGLDQIGKIGVPAIVLVNTNGYNHFVVITGMKDDKVLVSDSAIGTRIYPRAAFDQSWSKVALLITARADLGEKYFNQSADWKVVEKPPLRAAIPDSALATWRIMMRGPNDF